MIWPWLSNPRKSYKARWTLSRTTHRNGDIAFSQGNPCKVMVFGSKQPPHLRWKLGSDTIEVVEQHLHFVILHSTKSTACSQNNPTDKQRSFFFFCSQPLWHQVVWCTTVEYLQDRDRNVWKGASEDPADNTSTPNKMSKSWMVGTKKKNIKDIILKDKLIFLHSILWLPDHAAPKQILLSPPEQEAESKRDFDPMTRCCTKPGAPAPHWKITHSADLLTLTTRSNFRVSLILVCV